ncbi:hypothetical protein Dimus_014503 [Dionaea muscipula]
MQTDHTKRERVDRRSCYAMPMELLYLLCSILYASLVSAALSLLLLLRSLFRRFRPTTDAPAHSSSDSASAFYDGIVWHERRRPVHHSFRYRARYALFDLDRAHHAPPDHLSADEARKVANTDGPVFLLTIPPSVGYEQNPLSLYYCYDLEGAAGTLKKCIAEVTNTPWGERVSFVFDPNSDLVAKPLHVSPFMDMQGSWSIKATAPGEDLCVVVLVQHPELGHYFSATLKAKMVPNVSDDALFFWLMPQKVALWIYWQGLKLWWKNVVFIQHPRYANPGYREQAVSRDQKLRCCAPSMSMLKEEDFSHHHHVEGRRWFKWRDAKWPWQWS